MLHVVVVARIHCFISCSFFVLFSWSFFPHHISHYAFILLICLYFVIKFFLDRLGFVGKEHQVKYMLWKNLRNQRCSVEARYTFVCPTQFYHWGFIPCIYCRSVPNFLGWTCESWEESACWSWQQLHCQTLLFISRWWVSLSYYGVPTWWRYDDFTHEKGYFDWRWSQILCCRNGFSYWVHP